MEGDETGSEKFLVCRRLAVKVNIRFIKKNIYRKHKKLAALKETINLL